MGSKLAHSSPTLIAACHVLHRLYAPRHPPIALTSRLRVHTTNDNTGSVKDRHETRQSSAAQYLGVDDNLSLGWKLPIIGGQPDGSFVLPICSGARFQSEDRKPTPSRHRFEKPIHNVKKLAGPARNTAREEQISLLHHSDIGQHQPGLVEPVGIEPTTSSLQS